MAKRETGGSAFPRLEPVERFDEDAGKYRESLEPVDGMELRDYFAGQALAGIMANGSGSAAQTAAESGLSTSRIVAMTAYALADEMLKARGQ